MEEIEEGVWYIVTCDGWNEPGFAIAEHYNGKWHTDAQDDGIDDYVQRYRPISDFNI